MSIVTIWTLAQKEMRDALHNRWFLLYTIAFVGLSLAFSYMALAGAGIAGLPALAAPPPASSTWCC